MRFVTALLLSLFLLPSARAQDCTATSEIAQLTSNSFANLKSDQGLGQSFTPTCSGVLQGIEVDVQSVDSGPIVGTLRIMSADGSGETIATAPYSLAETGLQRIPMLSLVSLTGGETYTFFLDAPTSGGGNLNAFNGDPYSGGLEYVGPTADNLTAFAADLTFKVDLGAPTTRNLNDAVEAYVWANQETSEAYTPDPNYSYNVTGGTNTIVRTDVGAYTVTLEGIDPTVGTSAGAGGNVQVSAYGSNAVCTVTRWAFTPLEVNVQCVEPTADAPVDSRFTMLFTRRPETESPEVAYAFAGIPDSERYTANANYAFNPTGGSVGAGRFDNGTYGLDLSGFSSIPTTSGHLQTTAYSSSARCSNASFRTFDNGFLVTNIRCSESDASVASTAYSALFMRGQTSADGGAAGYVHAAEETSPSYTPDPNRSFSQNGREITAERTDTGIYSLTFNGLGSTTALGGTVQVTAFSSAGGYCTVGGGWNSNAVGDMVIGIHCFDDMGVPADREYSALYLWPDNEVVAVENEEDELEGATRLEAYPNPSSAQATFRYSLEQPGHVELAIYDALGRQLDVLVDEQTGAGVHTATLDVRSLPVGVYIVRMQTGAEVTSQRLTVVR